MQKDELQMTVSKKSKKKNGFLKGLGITVCVLAVLALIGFGAYHAILNHYLNKINIVTEEEKLSFVTERISEELPEETETVQETVTEEEEIDLHGTFGTGNLPLICDTKNVTNILLLATDSRKKGGAGRSDTMILVSINEQTGKIVLCSFLRDLYVKYPTEPQNPIKGGYDKLTHAHAYGGPALTMAVLKETFNIDVKHYAKVDFFSFVKVVDSIGGVDIELTTAEVRYINKNEYGNAKESKTENYQVAPLEVKAGVHHLNGVQALTHARNRSVGSDHQRTTRQRALITAMVKKTATLSLAEINQTLEVVLPLITTNMQKDTMKSLIGKIPAMIGYDMESTKIPLDGTYTSKRYNLVPNLEKNCYPLYEKIYGEPAVMPQ